MARKTSAQLSLATQFEEHWQANIRAWFERASQQSWRSELKTVVLAPSRSHGYFLRAQLLKEGLSFAGINFWTPDDARAFLANRFARESQVTTRENLRLLLAAAAESHEKEPAAAAVALEPDSFLRVIDGVEAAGWNFTGLPVLQNVAEGFLRSLAALNLRTVAKLDESLLQEARANTSVVGALIVWGFTAADWRSWTILRAACYASTEATICLNQPRPKFAEIESAWVGSWEEKFGAVEQAPAIAARSHFSALAESVELGDFALNSPEIIFHVGANTNQQAQVIVAQALSWLADENCERIGLIFPGYGALSREVAAILQSRGVPHHDSLGHLRPGMFENEAWRSWLALQENPRLSTLAHFLRACPAKLITPLRADEIEEALRYAFAQTLINDLAVLAAYLGREQSSKKTIAEFLRTIEFLPERAPFAQFNEVASCIFDKLEWSEQTNELAHQSAQLRNLAVPISRRNYLRWLAEITNSFQRTRDNEGSHPYARIHLVSYAHAQGQRWSHLILTALNEGTWPPRPGESGYLGELEIEALNARIIAHNKAITRQGRQGEGHLTVAEGKAFYLGPRQQRWLAGQQFIDLIESTSAGLCATASLLDETDPARRLKPGDFFNRVFFAARSRPISDREMDALHAQTNQWLSSSPFHSAEIADEKIIAPMLRAFRARRDITQPFGPFEFALATPPKNSVTISCSDWDRIVHEPASIWMKNFAGVEAPDYEEETEPWPLTLGTWVHNWLAEIAPARDQLSLFPKAADFLAAVQRASQRTRAEIEQLVTEVDRKLPAWWLSVWGQAAYFAGSLARLIGPLEGWSQAASEFRIDCALGVPTEDGDALRLYGRIDLLLADEITKVPRDFSGRKTWVIDYKTGGYSKMSQKELEHGRGFQLALYALALRELGADEVAMSIIKPDEPAKPQLSLADLDNFERVWTELARMQESGVFGANGDMRSEFGGAIYPLATLMIDADVLAEKWDKTHRGFVAEEEDDSRILP